jgi:hypothetical protein
MNFVSAGMPMELCNLTQQIIIIIIKLRIIFQSHEIGLWSIFMGLRLSARAASRELSGNTEYDEHLDKLSNY